MTRHGDSMICARRSGPTFLEAVRIGPGQESKCPDGLTACTADPTTAIETTCVNNIEDCPIIDVKVVKVEDSPLPGYKLSQKAFTNKDGQQYLIAYSTEVSSSGYEPFVESVPLNSDFPCFGEDEDNLILPYQTYDESFTFEIEDPLEICSVKTWRKVGREDEEKRYLTVFQTNLYDLQEANGVYEVLTDHL